MITFGAIADCQYADVDTDPRMDRHYRDSRRRLTEAVAELNRHELDFLIHLGDLIDHDQQRHAQVILDILAQCRAPVHHVIGNHDYYGTADWTSVHTAAQIVSCYQMPSSYYAVRRNGWRLLHLNSNENSPISLAYGTPEWAELAAAQEQERARGKINARPWNGAVGQTQLAWLRAELAAAAKADEAVVAFVHHPPYPLATDTMLNGDEFLQTLSQYRGVAAVFSGHDHDGAFATYAGPHGPLPCVTLCGMVETAQNAYAVVRIDDSTLTVTGFGRQPDLSFTRPR